MWVGDRGGKELCPVCYLMILVGNPFVNLYCLCRVLYIILTPSTPLMHSLSSQRKSYSHRRTSLPFQHYCFCCLIHNERTATLFPYNLPRIAALFQYAFPTKFLVLFCSDTYFPRLLSACYKQYLCSRWRWEGWREVSAVFIKNIHQFLTKIFIWFYYSL